MATEQLLVRIPEELARRLRRAVPPRQRSRFIERLLEQALPADEFSGNDPLYLAALAAEEDAQLAEEMAEWEACAAKDGIWDDAPVTRRK